MYKRGKVLRERLQKKEILVAPGAHDVMTGKIIEAVGFEAVYMTGYGTTASILGSPDVGLLTLQEMASRAACMAQAVNVPVIADADTGYGNVVNVIRTTKEYERAGVACMQLEDQVLPKKCGHMMGRQIVPMEEMVGKIKAAVETRTDPDNMLIMARTDARTDHGIDEVIRRGKAYEAAGADILFLESLESEEEMRLVNKSFGIPCLANMLEHGRTPLMSAQQLEEIGYDLVIYCVSSTYVAAKAVWDLMECLKKTGTTEGMIPQMITFEAFNKLVGLPEIRRIERDYHSGRDIKVEDGK